MPTSPRFEREPRRVMRAFSAREKRTIEEAFRGGRGVVCPSCTVGLDERTVVSPHESVSYVRDRVVLSCPSCRGHLVLDRRTHE